MALVLSDRIKETTTTTGTGTYTLGGAVSGFETFTANLSNGDTTYYCCTDGTDFEVGLGTYASTGTKLTRTTIISSSNSNNAVNWSSGSRDIFCTLPGSKAIAKNGDGDITLADDEEIKLGTGGDLQIFHNGNNSFIKDSGTGALILQTNDLKVHNAGLTDLMIRAIQGNQVELYYDNGKKLETTSGGVTITGTLTGNVTGDLTGNADTASAVAADNISAGDAAINLTTTSGNITIDAQASDSDIIFKGTDGGSDITFLTFDGSDNGNATFRGRIISPNGFESDSYFWMRTDNNTALFAGANFEVRLTHKHNQGFVLTNAGTGTPAVELQFVDANEAIGSDGTNLKLTSGGHEITVPNGGSDTMTLNAATQTLTNKTLTSPKINEDVAVTATATEINKLDGVTATTTELNYVDVTTLGTVEASKAVTADANGDITFTGANANIVFDKSDDSLEFADDAKITFGGVLEIFHDGNANFIKDGGTGNLRVLTNEFRVKSSNDNENIIRGNQNGSVILYHNNNEKLETTTTGIDVTGDLTTSADIELGHASDTTIARASAGVVTIEGNTVLTTGNSDTPTTTTSSSDADFVLVDDGGTMKKITPSNLGITSGGASKGFAVAMAIAL